MRPDYVGFFSAIGWYALYCVVSGLVIFIITEVVDRLMDDDED